MKNIILACIVFVLSACGGGAGDESLSTALARKAPRDRTLAPEQVSLVNTTTAGQQVLRSIGATPDGGYTVAWVSNDSPLYLQHYDSAGQKLGGETLVSLNPNQLVITAGSVLADGGVVVAYFAQRSSLEPDGLVHARSGIFIQRFDADGVQVQAETEVASRPGVLDFTAPLLGNQQTAALQDGGFVVAWTLFQFGSTATTTATLSFQRYDSQGQPVGGTVTVGSFLALGYQLTADAHGGFTFTLFHLDNTFNRVSIIHYDANQVARQLAVPMTSSALALPLEGRYVLFASDATGAWQQMLDSAGDPAGPQTPISAVPDLATELADGTYMVFWVAIGSVTAQRYDASGAPMGDLMTINIGESEPRVAALLDGGFALAWTAVTSPGDLDVYTQRFVELFNNNRKACLDDAKEQGLRGHDRKAFMRTCLTLGPR
jgi:hypothetical protein